MGVCFAIISLEYFKENLYMTKKPGAGISKISRFPATSEMRWGMETANSIEGANYLLQRIKELADDSKFLNKSPELKANVIGAIEKFVEFTIFKFTPHGQPWSGQPVENAEKNMHQNIADAAVKELEGKLKDIRYDYAVNQSGHYVRCYVSDDKVVDSQTANVLDQLVNSWLASKDYIIKDGYLYGSDDTLQNETTRLNSTEVKKLLVESGLQEYLAEKGFNATMKEQDYPGEVKEAKKGVKAEASKSTQQSKGAEPEETPHVTAGTR
jgi:hypothetical protein